MKISLSFRPRPNRRATLRDLYIFGLIDVFRQPSIFRVWEPLREHRSGCEPAAEADVNGSNPSNERESPPADQTA